MVSDKQFDLEEFKLQDYLDEIDTVFDPPIIDTKLDMPYYLADKINLIRLKVTSEILTINESIKVLKEKGIKKNL